MDEERAKELFREYVSEINRVFYSEEEIVRMNARCMAAADALAQDNFYILSVRFFTLLQEQSPEGATVNVGIISHKLSLKTFTDDGEEREIDYAEAVTKLYDAPRPKPSEMVDELLKSLSEKDPADRVLRSSPPRLLELNHTEQHAFQRALARHWSELRIWAKEQGIELMPYDTFSVILASGRELALNGDDVTAIDFILKKEGQELGDHPADFELECGCGAGEHLEILESWHKRNREPDS